METREFRGTPSASIESFRNLLGLACAEISFANPRNRLANRPGSRVEPKTQVTFPFISTSDRGQTRVIWAELDIEYLDCLECCVSCHIADDADVLLRSVKSFCYGLE